MKNYFLIFICCVMQLHAMEMPKEIMIIESEKMLSAPGHMMHKELACCYLQESGIDLKQKFILDVGCKAGEVSHHMAELSGENGLVMGIDSDEKKIKRAKKQYKKLPNLSFHQDSIKSLEPSTNSIKFHVATLFNCFDLIDDKREACKRIHKCLNAKGELLVNAGWGKEPLDLEVTREMIKSIPCMATMLLWYGLGNALERPYPTEQEYHSIFKDSGFEIISITKKMGLFLFEDSQAFIAMKQPIVMNRPEIKALPCYMQGYIFNKFIEKFLAKLQKNEQGYYVYPIEEILIHARKK